MNTLIINGHPDSHSFCHVLAENYELGCELTGNNCELINLLDLDFNPVLKYGYKSKMELEPDLLHMQQLIMKAHYLVFVFPIWWEITLLCLKDSLIGFFLPEFAFKYKPGSLQQEKN